MELDTRTGLPDSLRILLGEVPREMWQAHPNFAGLVSFWLERHMMFRKLMGQMLGETEAFLDRKRDPNQFSANLARSGGLFLNELHGHHQIEDHHYFPLLRQKDRRIETGFDLLDADHHALDGLLNRFVVTANESIGTVGEPNALVSAAKFRDEMIDLERLIGRHLEDEEDLIVPVILKFGAQGLG